MAGGIDGDGKDASIPIEEQQHGKNCECHRAHNDKETPNQILDEQLPPTSETTS
jgi:hypothetical protein